MSDSKAQGTYACPRCGLDEPHAHGRGARFKLRTFEYVIVPRESDEEESTWAYNTRGLPAHTVQARTPKDAAERVVSGYESLDTMVHVLVRSRKGIITGWWVQDVTRRIARPGASGNVVVEQPST